MNENTCFDCKYLRIKDFVIGFCDHPRGLRGQVDPEDFCSWYEPREVPCKEDE